MRTHGDQIRKAEGRAENACRAQYLLRERLEALYALPDHRADALRDDDLVQLVGIPAPVSLIEVASLDQGEHHLASEKGVAICPLVEQVRQLFGDLLSLQHGGGEGSGCLHRQTPDTYSLD